jgi:hypothetical protein
MELLTVAEAAEVLKVSTDYVTRKFGERDGVVDLGTPALRGKRRKRCLRIPRAVLDRFVSEHSM